MSDRRWLNNTQPQTLQIAVFLLYINAALAAFNALSFGAFAFLTLLIIGADVAGAYGIANEKKWGYFLAVAVAFLPFVLRLVLHLGLSGSIVELAFEVALVALLLHPQSREYQRIWFK